MNSGGVVFFALFGSPEADDAPVRETAAVIKITSSRMATQSERLGYEFAKRLGVQTPQVCGLPPPPSMPPLERRSSDHLHGFRRESSTIRAPNGKESKTRPIKRGKWQLRRPMMPAK